MKTKQRGSEEAARAQTPSSVQRTAGRMGGQGRRGGAWASRFFFRVTQGYIFLYLILMGRALVGDVLLRQQMDAQGRELVGTLAWVSTGLYALALVVVLVTFGLRLHRGKRHTWGLRLLYLGLASGLVARGYFGASFVRPELQRGILPTLMTDVGLFAATVILIGLLLSMVDTVRFVGRTVVGWMTRASRVMVRLPWPRRGET